MPLGDDRLLELLSGYLDGTLDATERVEVESALTDPAAQELLVTLEQNRSAVANLASSAPGLSADFTSRIMDAIDSADVSDVQPATMTDSGPNPASKSMLIGIATIAAALVFAVMAWPPLGEPGDQLATNPPENEFTEPSVATTDVPARTDIDQLDSVPGAGGDDVRYVSDLEWRMSMALVLHVAPTQQAQQDGMLQSILAAEGIRSATPIVADDQLQSLLLDSEMIVTDETVARSALYYVRAKATAVDAALQKVWGDGVNFPSAYFNLSIDSPESKLMEQIAHSTGKRFTVDQAFVAPVGRLDNGKPRIELPAFKSQEVLVTKQGRSGMLMSGSALNSGGGGGEMADLLILVKLP
ncbi:MAG: hypothetical protein Aurels2KO_01230 [Aureliella sp.]